MQRLRFRWFRTNEPSRWLRRSRDSRPSGWNLQRSTCGTTLVVSRGWSKPFQALISCGCEVATPSSCDVPSSRVVQGKWSLSSFGVMSWHMAGTAPAYAYSPSLHGLQLVDDPNVVPDRYEPTVIWEGLNLIPYAFAPHLQIPQSSGVARDGKGLSPITLKTQSPFLALDERPGQRKATRKGKRAKGLRIDVMIF